jgi:phospholipid/cholesterol/gamma-HCH transport system ATP-binding protein
MKTAEQPGIVSAEPKKGKPVLELKNLHKSFGGNKVLNGFNLALYEGENLVVVGKSGSGKTVMIKCIVGLVEIDSGTVNVFGRNIIGMGQEEMDELRTEIGFLFQGSALYDSMTVRENLEFPMRRHKKKMQGQNLDMLVHEALDSVGLAHTVDMMPSELSGGMKRRVALARTLILKPRIILYDEPTSGLDPITSKEIILLMLNIQKKYNTSSLIITHDMDCARVISNRMIILVDGINYAEGTYDELKKMSDPKVQAFFK